MKMSARPLASPATRLVASDWKATIRPSRLMPRKKIVVRSASVPSVDTLTRSVRPEPRSCTNVSLKTVSPLTRLSATKLKATRLPSPLMTGSSAEAFGLKAIAVDADPLRHSGFAIMDEDVAEAEVVAGSQVGRVGREGHEPPVGANGRIAAGPFGLSAVDRGNADALGDACFTIVNENVADVVRIAGDKIARDRIESDKASVGTDAETTVPGESDISAVGVTLCSSGRHAEPFGRVRLPVVQEHVDGPVGIVIDQIVGARDERDETSVIGDGREATFAVRLGAIAGDAHPYGRAGIGDRRRKARGEATQDHQTNRDDPPYRFRLRPIGNACPEQNTASNLLSDRRDELGGIVGRVGVRRFAFHADRIGDVDRIGGIEHHGCHELQDRGLPGGRSAILTSMSAVVLVASTSVHMPLCVASNEATLTPSIGSSDCSMVRDGDVLRVRRAGVRHLDAVAQIGRGVPAGRAGVELRRATCGWTGRSLRPCRVRRPSPRRCCCGGLRARSGRARPWCRRRPRRAGAGSG